MSHRVTRLFITGTLFAGTSSLTGAIGALLEPPFVPFSTPYGSGNGWSGTYGPRRLRVRTKYRTTRVYDVILDGKRNPEIKAEGDFLRVADGVLFVVDSQTARREANIHAVAVLGDLLVRLGRDVATLPVVFALNKRDLPELDSVALLADLLHLGVDRHLPTVATTGEGVVDVLEALLAMV